MNEEQKRPTIWSPLLCWVLVIIGAGLAVQSARGGYIESLSIGVVIATAGLYLLAKGRCQKQGSEEALAEVKGRWKNLRFVILILAILCLALSLLNVLAHMGAACLFLLSVHNLVCAAEYRAATKKGTEQ
jgi:lysylphosphatidylglycerol synthetase-like protein (DUF2156 family)